MAKAKYIFLSAELQYPKVFYENRDMGNAQVDRSDTDGAYTVTLVVDDATKEELIQKGIPAKQGPYDTFKKRDDGRWSFNAKRPHKHPTWTQKDAEGNDTGEPVVFGPPKVFDLNKAQEAQTNAEVKGPLTDYIVPWTIQDGLIGNGSKAQVKLKREEGIGTQGKAKGKAWVKITLESIALTDVVAYESSDAWF